ncbi:MAG: DUF3048 domain-containing protein, partial [Candidatus Riflebacteria bacterium]|nr:DUF3048 domain-containing protein [Candidatus Riflebacteria bacterium]
MNRLGILIVVFLLLNVVPVSRGASDNIIEIRQYFELRDTISLMNLEMKRALAPGSNSSLLSEPDGNKQLSDFIGFIESRIDSFAQSDTPLKYHYLKKLNNLFVEAKHLHAALLPKLKAASASSVAAVNNTVKVVPAPKEQTAQLTPTDKKIRPKPFFDSIGMRTLAPASSSVRFIRPDLVKTPVAIQPAVSERQNVPALLVPSSAAKPVVKSNAASMTGSVKPKKITRPANEAIERAKADLSRPPIPITPVKPVIKNESVIASEPVKMTEAKKIPEPAAVIGSGPVKTLTIVEPLNPVKPTDKVELVEPLKIVDTVQIASMAEPVKALQASGSEDPGKVAVTASASKVLATAEKPAPVVPAGTGVMRPLAIMIENHNQSRPQSGLDQADVVYEMPVEGGITR